MTERSNGRNRVLLLVLVSIAGLIYGADASLGLGLGLGLRRSRIRVHRSIPMQAVEAILHALWEQNACMDYRTIHRRH